MKIERSFYVREDVVRIARDLIGKVVFTKFNDEITAGIIIETEAYEGVTDRASHAYGGRRTARTEVMYSTGGLAYVYLCYGVHSLFNIVTNKKNVPHAVLIRGIYPFSGLDVMLKRAGKPYLRKGAGSGPGKVSKLLGIHFTHSGTDLSGEKIWLEDRGMAWDGSILSGTRIGVEYAGEDTLLNYRFWIPEEGIRQ